MRELPAFLGSLCRNPTQVGCIAPSSPALSRRIASLVDPSSHSVLEIGPGTGAVTRALLENGIAPDRLWVIELDPHLCAYLRRQFRRIHVVCGDALYLSELLPPGLRGRVSAIVSSLPLMNMKREARQQIATGAFDTLARDGQLIQYTYGMRCPIPTKGLPVTAERVERIWSNCPPAMIWRYRKNRERAVASQFTSADCEVAV